MFSRRDFLAAASCAAASALPGPAAGATATYDRIIDVYDPNQLKLDEAKRNDIGAIIYQIGRGRCYVDKAYKAYREKAQSQGFLWGAYFMLSTEPNKSQLDQLAMLEDTKNKSILVAIDWETACNGRMKYPQIKDFVNRFTERFGFYPMIYGGDAIRECPELIHGDELFAKCPVWYLRYRSTPLGLPTKTWPTYSLWQYDDEKRKNGAPPADILNGADWSRYHGDFSQLNHEWPFRHPA